MGGAQAPKDCTCMPEKVPPSGLGLRAARNPGPWGNFRLMENALWEEFLLDRLLVVDTKILGWEIMLLLVKNTGM